jgi:hypothetical protein
MQSRITTVRSRLLRRTTVLVVIAASGAAAASLGAAAPAGAIIGFCNIKKTHECTTSQNGCFAHTSTGIVITADDGDSFIDINGRKWTCHNGNWTVTLTSGVNRAEGHDLGAGLLTEGDPSADPCRISESFCPPSPPPTTAP